MPSTDTQFKPGVSGNPKGKPKLTQVEKAVRQAVRSDIAEAVDLLKDFTIGQLEQFSKSKKIRPIEKGIADAMREGFSSLDKVLDRLLGKSRTVIDHKLEAEIEGQIDQKHNLDSSVASIIAGLTREASNSSDK